MYVQSMEKYYNHAQNFHGDNSLETSLKKR